MNALIQKTKLHFPSTRAGLVVRPRLLAQLNALHAPGRRLALISAPAGSGKTTLVVQWLAAQPGRPAAWLSLDARDNQPAAFFAGLIAALQTIHPHAGKEALDLLALPGVNLQEVVTLLVNDLAAVPSPFILVLDDLHHIADHAVHQALDLFLDAQPPGLRLLLLSREDPPLPLAQRRAGGQLVEIRQDDLRFTLPEAILFLNQSMGLDLAPRQVELLEARTEGWIAGLQLAALSLQRATDSDAFIRAFSGSHRFILDYLLEEVLSHQTEERQRFLVETSILERMCAPLCATVTGRSVAAAQELLDGLDRANLFVVPLDEERCWYRYHHLFGDLLRARLAAGAPEHAVQLCRRAATWHEENGDPRQAVEYALRAGDALYAARLIERHYAERWQMADLDFLALVNRLPPEIVEERPSLCLNSAWLHVLGGQAERIPPFLEAAERALANPARQPEPADAANRAFARIIRAALDTLDNRPVQLDQGLDEAFAAIPAQNAAMRNSVAVMLGTIATMQGDFARAIPYYQDALEREKRLGGTVAIALCVMRLVWIRQAEGKLSQALDLVVEHEAYVRQRGARRFYLGGVLNVMWAEILLERNRLDEAESQLRRGLHLLEDWPMPQTLTYGLSLLARLQLARQDIAGAQATLQKAQGHVREAGFHPAYLYALQRAQVRLWMAERNVPALETFSRKTAPLAAQQPSFHVETPLVELCRAWIALGRPDEAAALLARLLPAAETRQGSRIAILALLAAAQRQQPGLARATLAEALALGEPEGYMRTFVDAGEPLLALLNGWLQRASLETPARLRAHAGRIRAAFGSPAAPGGPETGAASLAPEPLTPRELDVLRLLAAGCSNRQIAEQLVLAEGTVKFYVHAIFGKLDVRSRTQAIVRARELNLV